MHSSRRDGRGLSTLTDSLRDVRQFGLLLISYRRSTSVCGMPNASTINGIIWWRAQRAARRTQRTRSRVLEQVVADLFTLSEDEQERAARTLRACLDGPEELVI
jgi:hypothetical protein